MTTLALLKSEIADDLDRTDLTTQIASEINKAIRHYQRTRFYFNETRDETFATVADQKVYTKVDSAIIPKFIEIDQICVMDGTQPNDLDEINPKEWEMLTASGDSTGKPCSWTYFNTSFGFYPIPDQAYTVRPIGHIMKDAPADDNEADNVWMTEAFDLIRARACAMLAARKLRDVNLAQLHKQVEADEETRLLSETTTRIGTGFVTPTEF